jgi:hypothetical protein
MRVIAVLAAICCLVSTAPADAASIAVVNTSQSSDATVRRAIAAVNLQLGVVASRWHVARHRLYLAGTARRTQWRVEVRERSPVKDPATLGLHAVDVKPLALVFARPTRRARFPLSMAISHEVLEMAVNPYVWENRTFDASQGKIVYREVADPVQQYGYRVGGAVVSDFVFPSWFDRAASCPCDVLGAVSSPFQLGRGGVMPYDPLLSLKRATRPAEPGQGGSGG